MLKDFIISQRARKAHYLYSEIATYISSGEEVKKGNNMEDERRQMKNRIAYQVD